MIRRHPVTRAAALTVFLFSLLVWVYVVVIQITHPQWLPLPMSHVTFFPFNWRLDEIGMTAFAFAAVAFLIWQIELNTTSENQR